MKSRHKKSVPITRVPIDSQFHAKGNRRGSLPAYLEFLESRLLLSTGTLSGFADCTVGEVSWGGGTCNALQGVYIVGTSDDQDFEALASSWSLPVSNVTDLGGHGYYAFYTTANSPRQPIP